MTPVRRIQIGLAAAFLVAATVLMISAPRAVFAASSPFIESVTPSQGPASGGTTVTIKGRDFQPGIRVFIGGSPSPAVSRVSDTELTFTTPISSAATAGAANVLVQNPDGGAVQRNSGFYYTAYEAPLTITGVSPDRGPITGGLTVNITGTGFSPAAMVYFGSVPATGINVVGSSSMLLRAPANVAGPSTITIVNPSGERVTRASGYTYEGTVTVDTMLPGGGPTAGGATVTISGNGFAPGASVTFGGTAATSVTVVNPTQIVAVAPPNSAGSQGVRVTNANGATNLQAPNYTYGPPSGATVPTLTGVVPNAGSPLGGNRVNITGTGLIGGIAIYFGGVPSPSVSWNGSSSVFAQVPSNVSGPVAITIVNNDGSTATLPNAYTYDAGLGLSLISATPSSGPAGTLVTITGNGFNVGSWATFNGVPATTSTVIGSSQVIATVPTGLSGAVTVAVTQVGGLSTSLPGAFTVTGGTSTPAPTTPPVTPPPAPGGTGAFVGTPTFSASGQALVIFGGGTVDQLEAAAQGAKATGAWVQDGAGAYRLLVVGGPAFLKDRFKAQFPSGLGVNMAATLTR
ncbi:MAG: IPT/TIG domain-containing protein [Chloroflexi bacterium]|nr:IPT/TIG domain-containing protein [Chloroflexota bacterium]